MGERRYRAVFFDAGETLVHPYPSFPELLAASLRGEGYDVDPVDIVAGTSLVSDRFLLAAQEQVLWTTSRERSKAFWTGVYAAFIERLGLTASDGLPDRLYDVFTDRANYRLFDDVPLVLEKLRREGILLGVVSNYESWLQPLLGELGVADLFDVLAISGIEGVEKPDPRIFQLALDRAGVGARDAVYVGDNPVFDTEPAQALGMTGVLIDRHGRFPDHDGMRITAMSDLPATIGLASTASGMTHER